MGENVRYLMDKHNIVNSDRSKNIKMLFWKIQLYVNHLVNVDHKCTDR